MTYARRQVGLRQTSRGSLRRSSDRQSGQTIGTPQASGNRAATGGERLGRGTVDPFPGTSLRRTTSARAVPRAVRRNPQYPTPRRTVQFTFSTRPRRRGPSPERRPVRAPEDRLSAYDYQLPPELIAQVPADRRDASRLMVVRPRTAAIEHRRFPEFPRELRPGDLLVLNDTRVIPARLVGRRQSTGGRWEGLYLGQTAAGDEWRLIGRTRGRLLPGERLAIPDPQGAAELELELIAVSDEGEWTARCLTPGATLDVLARFGRVPLPPYIERDAERPLDAERYQTTYAARPGAVAAPTAGLHLTPELIAQCRDQGVGIAAVTLHVGIGTFRPVTVEDLSQHVMHAEWAEVSAEAAEAVRRTRACGGRVIAVGTTSVRTLETAARDGEVRAWSGETDIFLRPPCRFRAVDALLTNFHLPKSTLLMLVSALAGRELILRAYSEAIEQRYRFFSYGDAMLIDAPADMADQ
ncbi:MAG: tRNA preQ1(34) S-adenosylmethionine ribosyltransferase-isomerase QueA [Planctomyces sp.]|nr:tRNA preQ1(34) S-adenosylmethionine ribosyltransferase-isomerase QueA [Planctomyces sp.]